MNRFRTPHSILGLIVLSGVALGACNAPTPTAPAVTFAVTEIPVPRTVESVRIGDAVATGVAATLTAQSIGTQTAFAANQISVSTSVAETLTALPPTETITPSRTPPPLTETPTPTLTPSPTPTRPPVALPAIRATPSPSVIYPAPYTARPALWDIIVGQNANIAFAWRSNVLLRADERFIVYTHFTYDYDREPWSGWCITAWTQDTQWTSTGDWRQIAPGCFGEMIRGVQKVIQWKVIIQRYANEQVLGSLSPDSAASEFIWRPVP